jgi:dihydrolipoamide dehydrogenase
MSKTFDVVVIGAGPGGYPAAIRSAQLGKKVAIIETKWIGGECLNFGCIPSKALISAANFYNRASHDAQEMGIMIEKVHVDFQKLQSWKRGIQDKQINGVNQLLKGNKVDLILGTAKFKSSNSVEVTLENGSKEEIVGKNFVISTGATFISIPGFQIDEKDILSAKGALELEEIPKEFLIIGGGIIGLELGSVYLKLGSKVTIVELLDEILPGIDPSSIRVVKKRLRQEGVQFYTASSAKKWTKRKDGLLEVDVESKKDGMLKLQANKILLSVGKKASTQNLGLDAAGVKTDQRGFITTNLQQQTNVSTIYAVGDCTGMPFLAHRAMKQGSVAAEVIAGLKSESDFKAMPGAIFTEPEIAFVGLNEEDAKKKGYDVATGRVPFAINAKAQAHQMSDGFVKVIFDKKTEVLLGVEMVGPDVSNLISEAALGIEMGATIEDLGYTIHPHPTLSEVIMEASELALGKAIHIMNPLKSR